jgi:hypothetical protein
VVGGGVVGGSVVGGGVNGVEDRGVVDGYDWSDNEYDGDDDVT